MRRIKWKWALWMLLLLPVAALANSNKNIEKKLIESMGQNHIHNLSVGIIQSGKLTYLADLYLSESSGIAQSAGIAQPAGSALFRIASITKLFTGQAILQLAEKGKLSLDDKVERYIPELKNTEISIRQLLTHHASLQDRVWPEAFNNNSSFDTYIAKVLAANPHIHPSENFEYSDTGFNLLGRIISLTSGQNYTRYIQDHILTPAKMKGSGFYSGINGLQPSCVPFKDGKPIPPDKQWPYDPQFFPSEGLISNAFDLSQWALLVLNKDTRLLSIASYQEMQTPRLATTWPDTRIGLAWFTTARNGQNYSFHMGGIRGYQSIIAMNADTKSAIILLSNTSDLPRWELVDLIKSQLESR